MTSGLEFEVGQRLTVDIEKVAHGGHFIARAHGRVFFVRHAIPGESVEIEITSVGSSFLRADAVAIKSPSPDRVDPPCRYSGPKGCGGCDFQHISPDRQRRLKGEVVEEQFARIAKMEISVVVVAVATPLHWRTRISAVTNDDGKLGFYAHRSHQVIPIDECLIASKEMAIPGLVTKKWPRNSRIEISSGENGRRTLAIGETGRGSKVRITEGPKVLREKIGDMVLQVSQQSFWQSHEKAPLTLIEAIRPYISAGDKVLDLYGGVGLFTAGIIDLLDSGNIELIESSRSAVADASVNFAGHENVRVRQGEVGKLIGSVIEADVVILDPPREGAGKMVLEKVSDLAPRSIVYVACDPAALARDTAYLQEMGYSLSSLRAFDLFPMTHHIECVAHFEASQKG